MQDLYKLVHEYNTKLRMLGKKEIYYIENNKVYVDLNNVLLHNLKISDFVYGIVNKKKVFRNKKLYNRNNTV